MKTKILFIIMLFILVSVSITLYSNNSVNQNKDIPQTIKIPLGILNNVWNETIIQIDFLNHYKKNTNKNYIVFVPLKISKKFANIYSKALALGAYRVDLMYYKIHNEMIFVIDYLKIVNIISKELKIDKYMNFSYSNNIRDVKNNNKDSLIRMSTSNFNHINKCLMNQNNSDLSILLLAGSCIENLYILNQLAKINPSEEIIEKIVSQKNIINSIYDILNVMTEENKYFNDFKKNFHELKKVFDEVENKYSNSFQSKTNHFLYIENSKPFAKLTKKNINDINQAVNNIRIRTFKNN